MSRVWFWGSENPNNMSPLSSDYHVTDIFKMASKMAVKSHMSILLGTISPKDIVLVSSVWLSGSENPNNMFPLSSDYHLTDIFKMASKMAD